MRVRALLFAAITAGAAAVGGCRHSGQAGAPPATTDAQPPASLSGSTTAAQTSIDVATGAAEADQTPRPGDHPAQSASGSARLPPAPEGAADESRAEIIGDPAPEDAEPR